MSFLDVLLERLIWMTNGFLTIVYYTVEHLVALGVIVSAGAFFVTIQDEQRWWAAGSSNLAVIASLLAPAPVPLFLLIISLAGWVLLSLEQYNRPAQRWSAIRGQALYALAGLGFTLYRSLDLGNAVMSDPMMAQGAGYLNALIGVSMYVIPLGFLAYSAQSVFAHPPAPGGTPEQLITKVRSRGHG